MNQLKTVQDIIDETNRKDKLFREQCGQQDWSFLAEFEKRIRKDERKICLEAINNPENHSFNSEPTIEKINRSLINEGV